MSTSVDFGRSQYSRPFARSRRGDSGARDGHCRRGRAHALSAAREQCAPLGHCAARDIIPEADMIRHVLMGQSTAGQLTVRFTGPERHAME